MLNQNANQFCLPRFLANSSLAAFSFLAPRLAYCENGSAASFSWGALGLAGSMLVLLAFLFFLVFRWSQRNEQASYLGVVYKDTVFEFEFSRRKVRVDQKRREGEFRRQAFSQDEWLRNNSESDEPALPEGLYKFRKHRLQSGTGGLGGSTKLPGLPSGDPGGYNTIQNGWSEDPWEDSGRYVLDETDMDDDERALYEKWKNDLKNFEATRREWVRRMQRKEEELYYKQLDVARAEAEDAATRAADVDVSIFRGRGPSFVLQFTAVVVIIFLAVILGILQILAPEQIGTLLAAVAGYVLGRSTNGGGEAERLNKPEKEPVERHFPETEAPPKP